MGIGTVSGLRSVPILRLREFERETELWRALAAGIVEDWTDQKQIALTAERLRDWRGSLLLVDCSDITMESAISEQKTAETLGDLLRHINLFKEHFSSHNVRIIWGIPKYLLSSAVLRRQLESVCAGTVYNAVLPGLIQHKTEESRSLPLDENPPLLCAGLPADRQMSFSYLLRSFRQLNSNALLELMNSRDYIKGKEKLDHSELLVLAQELVNAGFLEPAYRIETYVRNCARGVANLRFEGILEKDT